MTTIHCFHIWVAYRLSLIFVIKFAPEAVVDVNRMEIILLGVLMVLDLEVMRDMQHNVHL
jgi:hypothetical protein